MRFSIYDTEKISKPVQTEGRKALASYRAEVEKVIKNHNYRRPEYALTHTSDGELHNTLEKVRNSFKRAKHLVLIGIGGSSLGVEAVHSALGQKDVKLSVLDTIAPYEIDILLTQLDAYKKVEQVVVCVISKSGATVETLVNSSVVLDALQKQFGKEVYKQTVYIGDDSSTAAAYFKRKKSLCITMPEKIGGRFSVATEVALVPLTILGHDVDAYSAGFLSANEPEFETIAADGAVLLQQYLKKGYRHFNLFMFDKRLYQVGAWYRQLLAESLGKATDKNKKPVTVGMLPTITTAVELHSVGQQYFSGYSGVFTEFVVFEDEQHEHKISKSGIAKVYGGLTNQEVAVAMYASVIKSYQANRMPYRSVIFDDTSLAYSLGQYMGLRMREVMYLADLLEINAFNQPNVESYKKNTRKILGL